MSGGVKQVDDVKRVLAISAPYALLVAVGYLWGYWGAFGLNVLEFVSPGDLVNLALLPFLGSIFFVLIGWVLGQITGSGLYSPGAGSYTRTGQVLWRFWRPLLVLDCVAIYIVGKFGIEPMKWLVVAFLFTPFFVPLTRVEYLVAHIPNARTRSTLASLVVLLPPLAFAGGRMNAYSVKMGVGPLIVDLKRSRLQVYSDAQNPVSYVGHIGNFFVLYERTNAALIIFGSDKSNALVLIRNPDAH
jgi:hypothetical protein